MLVGVDQRDGITGVDHFEVGDWLAQLRSRFEYGHAPHLAHSTFLRFKEKTVGVFVFETDATPYVVGSGKKGGPREIPWRYGSNTGPAGRAELLRVLLRRAANPEIEVRKAEVRYSDATHGSVSVELFVYPSQSFPELVVPFHRIEVQARDSAGTLAAFSASVSMRPRNPQSSLAKLSDGAVVISAPSLLKLHAAAETQITISPDATRVDLTISFRPAHFDTPVTVRIAVHRREHPDHRGYWELPEHHGERLDTVQDALDLLKAMAPEPLETPFAPLRRPW